MGFLADKMGISSVVWIDGDSGVAKNSLWADGGNDNLAAAS